MEKKKVERPGDKIQELLDQTGMSRRDLAARTNSTEKHICTLLNGDRSITASFAKKLGYVFEGYDALFWQNIQNEYDIYELDKQEESNISNDELGVLKNLGDILKHFITKQYVHNDCSPTSKVIQLRQLLNISDLTLIPNVTYDAAYRAQLSSNGKINPYVLFAWQRLCEKETENLEVSSYLNLDILKNKLNEIKELMFNPSLEDGCTALQELLATCGIAFKIVKHFRGAPVQGFIKQVTKEKIILCLTLRRQRADIFWFTLFHEIAHIINGDYKVKFVDFDSIDNEIEIRADRYARDFLIPLESYKEFLSLKNQIGWNDIVDFAKKVHVQPYIVLGRLQKDEVLDWSEFSSKIPMYRWLEK